MITFLEWYLLASLLSLLWLLRELDRTPTQGWDGGRLPAGAYRLEWKDF